jgi:hypothetical protein
MAHCVAAVARTLQAESKRPGQRVASSESMYKVAIGKEHAFNQETRKVACGADGSLHVFEEMPWSTTHMGMDRCENCLALVPVP